MSDYIRLDYSKSIELENKLKALPNRAEYETNNYLWSKAGNILEKGVYERMPRSKYRHSESMPKSHAKDTESLEIIRYNLGVKIQTKVKPKSKDFGYLIFPNEGRGIRQKNTGSQEFFEKTLESKSDEITNGLLNHLDKKIEEEI